MAQAVFTPYGSWCHNALRSPVSSCVGSTFHLTKPYLSHLLYWVSISSWSPPVLGLPQGVKLYLNRDLFSHYTASPSVTTVIPGEFHSFFSQDAILCDFSKKLKSSPLQIAQSYKYRMTWGKKNEKRHSEPCYPNYLVKAVTRGMSGTFERVLGAFPARGKPMLQRETSQL